MGFPLFTGSYTLAAQLSVARKHVFFIVLFIHSVYLLLLLLVVPICLNWKWWSWSRRKIMTSRVCNSLRQQRRPSICKFSDDFHNCLWFVFIKLWIDTSSKEFYSSQYSYWIDIIIINMFIILYFWWNFLGYEMIGQQSEQVPNSSGFASQLEFMSCSMAAQPWPN